MDGLLKSKHPAVMGPGACHHVTMEVGRAKSREGPQETNESRAVKHHLENNNKDLWNAPNMSWDLNPGYKIFLQKHPQRCHVGGPLPKDPCGLTSKEPQKMKRVQLEGGPTKY